MPGRGHRNTSTNLLLTAPTEQVATGDTVTVSIQIENVENVYGGRVKVSYDPNLFEVVLNENSAVTAGDFFTGQPGMTLRNAVDSAAGIVDYALTLRRPAEPISGSGLIGTISFRALASGTASFELVEATLSSPVFEDVNGQRIATGVDDIPVNVQALSLSVSGEPVAPVVEENAAPVVAATPVPSAPVQAPSSLFERPAPRTVSPAQNGPSPAILAGILFFVLGLLMFTFSLAAFIRLRQDFSLAS